MRKLKRFVLILLLVLVMLLLAAAGSYFLKKSTASTADFSGVSRIAINNEVGSVGVEGAAQDGISVNTSRRWSLASPRVSARITGSTLRLDSRCLIPLITCKVDYALNVPSNVEVAISSVSGDVSVKGVSGSVRVLSKVGSVNVEDLAGPLSVRTDAGSIQGDLLACTSARVFSRAGGIKLSFVEAPRRLDAESAAGNIVLLVPDAPYRVATDVKAGKAMVKVDRQADADRSIRARTAAGNIRIRPTS